MIRAVIKEYFIANCNDCPVGSIWQDVADVGMLSICLCLLPSALLTTDTHRQQTTLTQPNPNPQGVMKIDDKRH